MYIYMHDTHQAHATSARWASGYPGTGCASAAPTTTARASRSRVGVGV